MLEQSCSGIEASDRGYGCAGGLIYTVRNGRGASREERCADDSLEEGEEREESRRRIVNDVTLARVR